MIKYLGSVGTFIRLNDSENKTYKLLQIFSSSAASEVLFSASVNNLSGAVTINTASTSLYINGNSASVLPSQQWAHLTFSFDNKLWTYDNNNFLIRFGDTASSNFNIQNVYILENSFTAQDISYLHKEFTGGTESKLTVPPSASYSINIIDFNENIFTSASTGAIYQPIYKQKKYLFDIAAVKETSLKNFVSASLILTNDDLYVDTVNILPNNYILSLEDGQIYQLTASSTLKTVSSSVGDVVNVLAGQYFGSTSFIKTSASVFDLTPLKVKVSTYMNIKQPNNA